MTMRAKLWKIVSEAGSSDIHEKYTTVMMKDIQDKSWDRIIRDTLRVMSLGRLLPEALALLWDFHRMPPYVKLTIISRMTMVVQYTTL